MNSTKKTWPGFNEMGSLIVPLAWSDVPLEKTAVYIDEKRYDPKGEVHITVIGKKTGLELQDRLSQTLRTVSELQQKFESIDWSFTYGTSVHLLSKKTLGSRESTIVLPLIMPGMAAFYNYLRSRNFIASDTPLPPPHVTLFHRNCLGGIGVPDEKTLSKSTAQTFPIRALR